MTWHASTRPCRSRSAWSSCPSPAARRDHELPIAYNNLGATQYQLADYPAAEGSYRKSLELLESTQGISSRRLVVPLAGLGAVYAAQDQHAGRGGAIRPRARREPPRRRALQPAAAAAASSRRRTAATRSATSAAPSASTCTRSRSRSRTTATAMRARCRRCSSSGPSTRACASSSRRGTCTCARATSSLKPGVYDPQAVKALVGIARTHRLQYTMDPDTLDSQQPARDEVTGDDHRQGLQGIARAAARRGPHRPQGGADRARPPAVDFEPAGRTHDGNADRARRLVPGDVAPGRSRSPTTPRPRGSSTRRWRRTRSRATR